MADITVQNNRKLLTVAIPAYNVEKFIAQALDTVLDNRIEALVINDGSTDATEQIALEYQEKYPDIIRVITKPNGGWGSGINMGIREATGLYFANLDSDDWYLEKGLSTVLDNIEKHPVDIILATGIEHSMATDEEWPIQFPNGCEFEKEIDFSKLLNGLDHVFTIHSMFFKTEILQNNNVSIDECFYTDTELIAYPLPYIKSAFVQREPAYVYRVDRAGQSISPQSMAKHVDDMVLVAKNLCDWFLAQSGDRMDYYAKIVSTAVYGYITYPFALSPDKQGKYISQLRQFKADVLDKNEYLSDYSRYGIFARMVLNSNFNKYALVGRLWNFSMNHRKASNFIWRMIKK